MKKIAYLLTIISLLSCGHSADICQKKLVGNFAYVFPLTIEEEIWKQITRRNLETTDLFFQLRREGTIYHLLITPTVDINKEFLGFFKVSSSTRCLLLNERVYYMVFDSDYDFGSIVNKVESLNERKEKSIKNEYLIRRGAYTTKDSTFGIKFTKVGGIVL